MFSESQFGFRALDSYPKVSIITVVFNRANTIGRCIDSVAKQSYKNIQYIIIDGGSTDGTLEEINKYRDYISVVVSEKDEGIYDAMNKGIRLSEGEYVILLNSDDWFAESAVEDLMFLSLKRGADVVHADALKVFGNEVSKSKIEGWLHVGFLTKGMPLRHETMLVRKEIYQKFGLYDISYSMIADYVFVATIYLAGVRFAHLKKAILFFSMDGYSNNFNDIRLKERCRLFQSLFGFLEERDLEALSHGISRSRRVGMMLKYFGRSTLFFRSMLRNIISVKLSFVFSLFA